MNYIDINEGGFQSLYINLNFESGSITVYPSFTFNMFKDGNSTASATFSPYDDGNSFFSLNGRNEYYNKLVLNLDHAGFSELEDETSYLLECIKDGKVLYRGKVQTTSKDLTNYSSSETKYTQKVTNNNYTILE
mgnify:CR=1 FL=1|tara:strand:+ start:1175 stop:1576 length:402 start_codon:yes stop_codon:yes gene_type:complete